MKIILYNNHSENNNINKTIIKIVELSGTLREATSLIDPQIMIELDPKNFDAIKDDSGTYVMFNGVKITWDNFIYNNVLSANYMYIPDFNRYYFINDIVSFRNNLWLIQSHVDVICSYKDEILKTTAYVSRNEFRFNNKIFDDLRNFEYKKDVGYANIVIREDVELDSFDLYGDYLVSVTCDDAIYQYETPERNEEDISANLHTRIPDTTLGVDRNTIFYVDDYINSLFKAIYEDQNLRSYVKYLKVFPFKIPKKKYSDEQIYPEPTIPDLWTKNFHIGNKKDIYNGPYCYMPLKNIIIKKISDFILDDTFEYANKYNTSEPYTIVELWIPFYNYIRLPYAHVHNHRLQLYYLTSIGDGSTTVILYDAHDKIQLFSSKVECGVDIPFSTTNSYENEKRKDGLMMSTAIGTLSSVVSTAIGVLSHNPVMTAGGVMSGISTVTKAITSANQIFDSASVGVSSSVAGMYNSLVPYLRITLQVMVDVNENDYAKINGKPLKDFYKLGDLSGFTIVEDEHLENFGSCLKTESEEIKEILKNGIIL